MTPTPESLKACRDAFEKLKADYENLRKRLQRMCNYHPEDTHPAHFYMMNIDHRFLVSEYINTSLILDAAMEMLNTRPTPSLEELRVEIVELLNRCVDLKVTNEYERGYKNGFQVAIDIINKAFAKHMEK